MTSIRDLVSTVLRFPKPRLHYSGFILNRLIVMARDGADDENRLTIDQHQMNGAYGVHQARVRLAGDDTLYRLILAPASAPVEIGGFPVGEHFAKPLEQEG